MPPVYATRTDLQRYIDGLIIDDPTRTDALIMRAERDVDGLLGAIRPRDDTGLKLNPPDLLAWEAEALADVVAAQVEWLILNPAAGIQRPVASISGPDFAKTYADQGAGTGRIGPRVATELRRIGHLRRLSAIAR